MKKLPKFVLVVLGITLATYIYYVFFTCHFDRDFHKYLMKHYEFCFDEDSCKFKLSEFTEFEWDSVYVFYEWTSGEHIQEFVRINYAFPDVPDSYEYIVFINNDEVVYTCRYYSYCGFQWWPGNENERGCDVFGYDEEVYIGTFNDRNYGVYFNIISAERILRQRRIRDQKDSTRVMD